MDKKNYVFTYGTLRDDERNHYLLKDAILVARQAWTTGELYDTGLGSPAMKQSSRGRVYGDLYLVSDEELQKLDKLEGFHPGGKQNLFERMQQFVSHDSGEKLAYVYVISEKKESMLKTKIKQGDWKLYKFEKE
ncbi:gamma-glutamylcyclotransferase family protein [Bacillus marasmi]|uniref:gamma-glutamylcyclotransferase family protein n=1 Tax=Bacillus marasmi TaxID=1926279 RepID=UPI00164D8B06|nr:gamma-glutamylcyclotransferase family protein [Bacillus marasmi]